MSQPIDLILSAPPVDANPQTVVDFFNLVRAALSGSIPDPFTPYVVGSSTPSVGQQGYLWLKTDSGGRPLGLYKFYGGNWRRMYNGVLGEIRMYSGDPSVDFDGTGKGIMGLNWDGWALCNSANGTVNLTDKFIVAAHLDNSSGINAYSSGWQSNVTGAVLHTGGVKDITLDDTNTYRPARDAIQLGRWKADGNTADAGSSLRGSGTNAINIEADAGNLTPPAIPTVPPFLALAYCQFVGYS